MPRLSNRRPSNRTDRLRAAAFEALETRVLFSGGGDGGGPDPIEPDGFEFNNSFATATNLGTTNTYDAFGLTIHQAVPADVDFFKFTAPSSGVVGVEIDFSHLSGNLQLTGYNGSQTQIAYSNTSTFSHGVESFALNVTAGQTYYLKVSGVSNTVTSPDYSLSLQPLSVSFDWTMPKRFGNQLDPWGLPIVPNTRDYARPNPVVINGTEYPAFGVRLDASASFLGSTNVNYTWQVNGLLNQTWTTTNPVFTGNLPEGQYNVTLTASADGNTLSTSQTINVVDHLIVAVGDSYGAGEGNPHQVTQYDFFGFPTSGAKWAQGLDDPTTASHRRAHRSSYAGVVQAAMQLENSDPKSSVTLIFLDHTGAVIDNLISAPQNSSDPVEPGSDGAQLPTMASIVGNRKIDALFMSVGGNDAGFADIGAELVVADPEHDGAGYAQHLQDIWNEAASRRADMVAGYDRLASALSQYNIGHVFLTEYPDPTHSSSGATPAKILDDIADSYEIDSNELSLVRSKVLQPLAWSMIQSAHEHGWSYVSNIAEQFSHMGYGAGFRTASESVVMQGPVGNRNFPSVEEKQHTLGTLHPTADAQLVYRDRILASYGEADLVTTSFSLSPDAFLPNATGGYTITIKNLGQLATAGASTGRIFISTDKSFDATDWGVMNFNLPALAPGQSITLSGVLPNIPMPYIPANNALFVGAILDIGGQVAESDEINVPTDNGDIAAVKLDKDLSWLQTPLVPQPSFMSLGTVNANLGIDELIGNRDKDFYSFNVNAGDKIAFDVDNAASSPNMRSQMLLYTFTNDIPGNFAILQSYDTHAPDEPNLPNGESYMEYTFQTGGRYMVVVGGPDGWMVNPFDPSVRAPFDQGGYALTLSRINAQTPAVTGASFNFDASQSFSFTFNTAVQPASLVGGLSLTNLTSGQQIDPSAIDVHYDAPTRTATYSMHNAATILADGNYQVTLNAANVVNVDGTPMAGNYSYTNFFLAGDANRDRHVDAADQAILNAHLGASEHLFTHGDFNYDGVINAADQAILAAQMRTWLPAQGTLDLPATGGNDGLRLVNETASMTDIFINAAGPGVTWRVPRGAYSFVTFNAGAGDDVITLDYSNGSPLPNTGMHYDGGTGTDTINVLGTAGADTVEFDPTSFACSMGGGAAYGSVESAMFDGKGGWDQISIDNTTVTLPATQHLQSLTETGSAAVASVSAGINALIVTRGLSLAAGAKLDLNDNDFILDYTGSSQLPAVQSLINAARAGGAWTGAGITSSSARNRPQHNTTLGAMEATDYKSIYGATATFDGEAIDTSAVVVKYTYYGDADFNGKVNFDDYVRTDAGFNNHRSGWSNGDFNGSGAVNFDDYVLIDLAFNTQNGVL